MIPTQMKIELVAIGDDTLEATRGDDGRVYVVVRRVCEVLGIDAPTQRTRLQAAPWAKGRIREVLYTDALGRERGAVALDLEALPMWLVGIDVARSSEAVRAKLSRFQCEARDVLAQHFGVGWGHPIQPATAPGSGAAVASGAAAALAQLAVVEQMVGAIRATIADVEQVRTLATQVKERQEDIAVLMDRWEKRGVNFRESARAIKTAAAFISKAIRAHCAKTGTSYEAIYSECRRDLMLPKSRALATSPTTASATKVPRPKTISESIKRADQCLTYARTATRLGVPGVDVRTINRILNADDDANTVDMPTEHLQ